MIPKIEYGCEKCIFMYGAFVHIHSHYFSAVAKSKIQNLQSKYYYNKVKDNLMINTLILIYSRYTK